MVGGVGGDEPRGFLPDWFDVTVSLLDHLVDNVVDHVDNIILHVLLGFVGIDGEEFVQEEALLSGCLEFILEKRDKQFVNWILWVCNHWLRVDPEDVVVIQVVVVVLSLLLGIFIVSFFGNSTFELHLFIFSSSSSSSSM